jgi:hypothetical protein
MPVPDAPGHYSEEVEDFFAAERAKAERDR